MIAMDIVNEQQIQAMANFAESRLAHNLEEEHNVRAINFLNTKILEIFLYILVGRRNI